MSFRGFVAACVLVLGAAAAPAGPLVSPGPELLRVVSDPARPRFYVTTQDSTLLAVDVGSASVAATEPLPALPAEMLVEPGGARLFVGLPSLHAIAIVDLATFRVTSVLPLSGRQLGPAGLAAGPGRLYAAFDDGLSIVDTATLAEIDFHSLPYGVHADSLLALAPDGRSLYAVQRGWSPSSLYAHDVAGDGCARLGEECCHGCVDGVSSGIAVSADGRHVLVGSRGGQGLSMFSSAAMFHDEHVIPVDAYSDGFVLSPDGSTAYVSGHSDLLIVDVATLLPWREEALRGYAGPLAYQPSSQVVGVIVDTYVAGEPMALELVSVAGLAPNRGGVKLRRTDMVTGVATSVTLMPDPYGGVSVPLDLEQGVHGSAPLAPGRYEIRFQGDLDTRIPADVVAGEWTDLGDVEGLHSGWIDDVCVSPPLERGRRQIAQVHGRGFLPGATVRFSDRAFVVHGATLRTWSIIDVDVTVPADARLGAGSSVIVQNPTTDQRSGTYWVVDTAPAPNAAPAEVPLLWVHDVGAGHRWSWEHVTLDVNGGPETVDHYEVLRGGSPLTIGTTAWLTSPASPATWTAPADDGGGDAYYLVRAVDAAGLAGPDGRP